MPARHTRPPESNQISAVITKMSEAVRTISTLFKKITRIKNCVYIHYRVHPAVGACLNNPETERK